MKRELEDLIEDARAKREAHVKLFVNLDTTLLNGAEVSEFTKTVLATASAAGAADTALEDYTPRQRLSLRWLSAEEMHMWIENYDAKFGDEMMAHLQRQIDGIEFDSRGD